jgi:hypothetical protein
MKQMDNMSYFKGLTGRGTHTNMPDDLDHSEATISDEKLIPMLKYYVATQLKEQHEAPFDALPELLIYHPNDHQLTESLIYHGGRQFWHPGWWDFGKVVETKKKPNSRIIELVVRRRTVTKTITLDDPVAAEHEIWARNPEEGRILYDRTHNPVPLSESRRAGFWPNGQYDFFKKPL